MNRATGAVLAVLPALSASATDTQVDTLVRVAPLSGNTWSMSAAYFGDVGAGINSVWAEVSLDIRSLDGSISDIQMNRGYVTSVFGPPVITGSGTQAVSIRNASMPGGIAFEGPDNDSNNPLLVMTFQYDGSASDLSFELIGQNSMSFVSTLLPLFGDTKFYQDGRGEPGELVLAFDVVPAPASAALLGVAALAATRRRRVP